jgi:hypothetical protein
MKFYQNNQGSILILTVFILGGALFAAMFALGTALKFASSSVDNLDVYSAIEACVEKTNGYASMACDTAGSCVDPAGACVACGSATSLDAIGECYCELQVATAGYPREMEARAYCVRGSNSVYGSTYVYYVTGGAAPGGGPGM